MHLILSTLLAASAVWARPTLERSLTATPYQYIHPVPNPGDCLTAASNTDGAAVEIKPCVATGSTSQNWNISGSTLQIFGDKCLDVTGGAAADGTPMQIWTCTEGDHNQQWTLFGATIQWSQTSSCLDLTNGNMTSGNVVRAPLHLFSSSACSSNTVLAVQMQIWACTGGPNQLWSFSTGPSGTPTPNQYIHPEANSGDCLTAASNTDGAVVEIEPCVLTGSTSQSWTIFEYTLSIFDDKCLDLTGGSATDGTPMQIWTCTDGDNNQEWTLSDGAIQWSQTSSCLDLTDGSLTNGNVMQIWGCTDGPNQQWTFTTGPGSPPTPNQYIHPTANSGDCLTAASNTDGAAVEIEPCISTGSASQNWTISGSTLQIFGNKCLDVTGGSAADGTAMQIWTCTEDDHNQQWTLSEGVVQWSLTSSCLDLTNGNLTNGNVMQIWGCTDGPNQQWAFTTGPGSGTLGHTISPGASSTTCLSAPTKADGGAVVVEPCDGSPSQSWIQTGRTIVVYDSMCLDVTNGNTTDGVLMQIWSCTPGAGDANQQFIVTSDNRIQWTEVGKCLDLTNGSLANGTQVQMWACVVGDTNQVWNIV
ncbi:ricin B lectin domain-containing protein [Mycena maculata]|uniref:Ricin B lectin domain-containing protein n=1 Tax=Mycena maculata TaxID=230809 RepID=A0AAD7NBR8_9AGAR|nr:ricin B lectin domain-containing protein [Mycena maculata]